MSRYGTSPKTIAKHLCIALAHPDYQNKTVLETLRILNPRINN